MKAALIVGLLVLVLYFASASPGAQPAQSLPPDTLIPALGSNPVLSPAMTGGAANITEANNTRLLTNLQNPSPRPLVLALGAGTFRGTPPLPTNGPNTSIPFQGPARVSLVSASQFLAKF